MKGFAIKFGKSLFLGLALGFLASCKPSKTELILLGTVHQPVENFNPDSLYNILEQIEPDLILYEVDSSFFTNHFEFNTVWESNEFSATTRYVKLHNIPVRPYDFTGRNEYRKRIGARPTDSMATQLLDSLYEAGDLIDEDQINYKKFLQVSDTLNSYAFQGTKSYNRAHTDSIAKLRQDLQYAGLFSIMKNYPIFSETYAYFGDGDSISYLVGYQRAGEFWKMRNEAMAKHILYFAKNNPKKKIVVLNGYFHRYYLHALLQPEQSKYGFVIKNFDEF